MTKHPGAFVDFRPAQPKNWTGGIGLIGCGGITEHHLRAYRDAGWNVVALCDLHVESAELRRKEYFPDAKVYEYYQQLLKDDAVHVVDIATHPPERVPIIRHSLLAGKHVLSQKPFVTDLDVGQELCDLAEQKNLKLAVNQNGRYAPHFCFARRAVAKGLVGDSYAAHMSVHWDHTWVRGTPFELVKHLVLYDFAIHWFDMLRCLLPKCQPTRVFASTARVPNQNIMPNLLGQALIEWDQGQSTLAFDASLPHGPQERFFVSGTQGSIYSVGPGYQEQSLTLTTSYGEFQPKLEGKWFPDGFRGTMGELLMSIEENRPCELDARDNLKSLALCFAAVASAEAGIPIRPFDIRTLPG